MTDSNAKSLHLLPPLKEALVTMLAALATLACSQAIAPGASSAVLSVVLAISLSRSGLDRDRRHWLESALALPIVGLAAVGLGELLSHWPWAGAVLFTAGMSASIWMRRFGATAARLGTLIALPFVALLVTPHVDAPVAGPVPRILVPIVIALLALAWVSLLHALARRIGFLPPARAPMAKAPERPAGTSSLRPDAPTRMAIQMAVALAIAFALGHALFDRHWAWIVLTAFIVLSGQRGRIDVAHKSLLRVAGAATGTVLALAASMLLGGHDTGTALLVLGAVFLGVWLRPVSYAWWALFVTIALALLQGFAADDAVHILPLRLLEIVVGAAIGVGVAWCVLPVRSTAVLRRRIADALAALSSALDPAVKDRNPDAFAAALDEVERLAPAFRMGRFLSRRGQSAHPADWIDALLAMRAPAIAEIERGETPGAVRRAVGAARQALREPAAITTALAVLGDALRSGG